MAGANAEFLRRAVGAYNERDFGALEAMVTADFEFVSMMSDVSGQAASYRGPDAWEQYFAAMESVWDDWRVDLDAIRDGGENGVVGVFRLVGTGRSSGIRAEQSVGILYEFRDGRMCRGARILDPAAALAAVGTRSLRPPRRTRQGSSPLRQPDVRAPACVAHPFVPCLEAVGRLCMPAGTRSACVCAIWCCPRSTGWHVSSPYRTEFRLGRASPR